MQTAEKKYYVPTGVCQTGNFPRENLFARISQLPRIYFFTPFAVISQRRGIGWIRADSPLLLLLHLGLLLLLLRHPHHVELAAAVGVVEGDSAAPAAAADGVAAAHPADAFDAADSVHVVPVKISKLNKGQQITLNYFTLLMSNWSACKNSIDNVCMTVG